MFNLKNKQSYFGFFGGLLLLAFGALPLLQELGFLFLFDMNWSISVYAGALIVAGFMAFTNGRSIYSYATSFSLMLMFFGFVVLSYGIMILLHQGEVVAFDFLPQSVIGVQMILIVLGAFIFGSSFRH